MKVIPTLAWQLATDPVEPLDPRLIPLLEAIAASMSLAAAVVDCGISYRAAWGLLREYQGKLGAPLVALTRGRGARLAPAGERLVAAQHAVTRRVGVVLPNLAVDLGPHAVRHSRAAVARLRVAASHDIALSALRDGVPSAAGLKLELAFMGSLHALEQFAQRRADVGGFHVPLAPAALGALAPFRRLLRAHRDRLIRFVDREQGFMLARGNPSRVRSFDDLAHTRLRFVNRQPGSGTRWLIDRILASEGIDPSAVMGYADAEITHSAVAATVASGAADAGFGLRAAAAEYGLAFVPRVRERYFLAVRATALATPAVARLIEVLQGPVFGRIASRLPGYRCEAAGAVVDVDAIGD